MIAYIFLVVNLVYIFKMLEEVMPAGWNVLGLEADGLKSYVRSWDLEAFGLDYRSVWAWIFSKQGTETAVGGLA